MHHNSIGVDYGSGFDYEGAVQAYRRAIELDPRNLETRQSLANVLEFNHEGVRYAPDAQLSLAIDAYRYVEKHQKLLQAVVVDNLAIDLFYAGRYEEAIQEIGDRPGTTVRLGVILASAAAWKGSPAAITVSDHIQGDEQRRKDALGFAAEGLWNKRLYTLAADLLTASLPDTTNGANVSAKIQVFRNLKPYTPADLPVSDPRRPVQRLLEQALLGTLDESSWKDLVSRHSYATDGDWSGAEAQQRMALAGSLLSIMKQTGLPQRVVADIVLGRMSLDVSTRAGMGASVRVRVLGLPPMPFYVVSEDGTWKIAASMQGASEVGLQALYLLTRGDAEAARSLLDWKYSLLENSRDAGDPLGGDLFTRLWAPPARTAVQAPLLAASALTTDAASLRLLVPDAIRAREDASTGSRRDDLSLLLVTMYLRLQDAPKSKAIVSSLLGQYPDSNESLRLAGESYALDHDWSAWKALLARRMESEPSNRRLLLERAAEASAEGDYTRAGKAYKAILDGPHGTPADYAAYAWLSLLEDKPDGSALAAAQQATLDVNRRTYQSLLTVACVDAALGHTAEAHQELLEAMSSAHLAQPDAGIWYGFGRIYEQYGVAEAAVSAYQRAVQMAGGASEQGLASGDVSVSTLASLRLNAMGK